MKIYYYLMLAALCINAHNFITASQAPAKTSTVRRKSSTCLGASAPQAIAQKQWPQPTETEVKEFLLAAKRDHKKVFELLQKYGPNIVNKKTAGESPILDSAAHPFFWTPEELERILQTPGIDIDIGSVFSPLTNAMFSAIPGRDPDDDQLKKIDLLIKHGANINLAESYGSTGFTPLMKAARDNHPKVVSMLLRAGASTDGKVTQGSYAGKTFFDFAKKHPAVQKVYDDYKQEVAARATEPLGGIRDLGNIVSEYL